MIEQTIKDGKELIDTMSFNDFTNKVNNSFTALTMLTELYKTDNKDLIDILNSVENGR